MLTALYYVVSLILRAFGINWTPPNKGVVQSGVTAQVARDEDEIARRASQEAKVMPKTEQEVEDDLRKGNF